MSDDLMNHANTNRKINSPTPKQNAAKKRNALIAALTAVILAVILVAGGIIYFKQEAKADQQKAIMKQAVEVDVFYPGIVVQGVELGGMTMEQAKTVLQAVEPEVRGNYNVKLRHGQKSWEITTHDLGFDYTTDEVLKEAYAYARDGQLKERYTLVEELEKAPRTYSIAATMKMDSVSNKISNIVKEIERAPKDATVESFDAQRETFTFTQGKNGLSVDSHTLTQQVEAILQNEKTGEVQISSKEVAYQVGVSELEKKMMRLGTYTTTSTNTKNGDYNMKLSMSAVNGTVVPAGGIFSYLKTVGNASRENGYLEAGAILNGKLIQSYGGGICQTSTTIYGAALRSNMEIVQRYNHSIRSSYCPIGQDAAVSYNSMDFKFKNTSKYPIYIASEMKGKKITVTFYGGQSPEYDEIRVESKLTQTIPEITTPKYSVDATLKKGTMKLDAKARCGYKAVAQRIFYKNGNIVRTENLPNSYYRPAPAFYSIGPDTDVSTAVLIHGGSSSSSASSQKPESSSAPASSKPESTASASSGTTSQVPPESTGEQANSSAENAESDIIIPE